MTSPILSSFYGLEVDRERDYFIPFFFCWITFFKFKNSSSSFLESLIIVLFAIHDCLGVSFVKYIFFIYFDVMYRKYYKELAIICGQFVIVNSGNNLCSTLQLISVSTIPHWNSIFCQNMKIRGILSNWAGPFYCVKTLYCAKTLYCTILFN